MSKVQNENLKQTCVTLISNGSSVIYPDNSLSSFSNKLHRTISLNPSEYNYVALQEIGVSLNLANVKVPIKKPSLIYFEWNLDIFSAYHPNQMFDLEYDDELKELFYFGYNSINDALFINYPNEFGISSIKSEIEDKYYTPSTLLEKLKSYENIYSSDKLRLSFEFNEDEITKFYLKQKWGSGTNIPSFLNQFTIKCNVINNFVDDKDFLGLLIHKNLAKALKLTRYFRSRKISGTGPFAGVTDAQHVFKRAGNSIEAPPCIKLDKESYFLYFLSGNEEIRGDLFYDNKIFSDDNDIINVDSNLLDPYILNEKYCSTIATFSNTANQNKFMYYSPDNPIYYKLRSNEIQHINIRILDKDYNQVRLYKDTPTIVKLIIKSDVEMDFTRNLRVSNSANNISNFKNKNSLFRVNIPTNEIFQSETSLLSISSITYPNRFKVLPSYLNADEIKRIYLYSKDHFNPSYSIKNSYEIKNIASDISVDPVLLTSNLTKKINAERIEWKYDNKINQVSVSTQDNAYILQIPCLLGNMLGMRKEEVRFDNAMVFNHLFKNEWTNYNVLYTTKFVDVMKDENNLSIYEILDKNNFPSDGFFYVAISYNDQYYIKNEINLEMHYPRYAFVYNNIIEDSIFDNSYYKILKTVYFEDSNTRWKTICYKNNEF